MQSTVRSETPRAAYLRSLSSTSVHVNREVTVVSTPAVSTPAVKRARYSDMASKSDGDGRPQTSPGPATVVVVEAPLNRWNSQSRVSNRPSLRYSRGSFQRSQDLENLEYSRESMKALAEFLMTKDPPPTNWISIPSDDEKSLFTHKKSALKIFGRRRGTKQKATRFLRLPDSAVAARTRSGARHIAISIPIEHDHIEKPKAPPAALLQPPTQGIPATDRPSRSAVTVLKPVAELRESGSSNPSSLPTSRNSATELSHIRQDSLTTPPVAPLGSNTTPTLPGCHTGMEMQQKNSVAEPSTARLEPARVQKSYIAVSPVMLRQDSQRSDPRHSGGTAYSTVSLGTFQGHSRGPSTVSTAPSATMISSLRPDLPPRSSSMSAVSQAIKTELAETSKFVNKDEPLSTIHSGLSETTTSPTASTPSSPLVFGTAKAEIVRSFSCSGGGGPQIVRSFTPGSQDLSPAPSNNPPDPTPAQDSVSSRPKTAPPVHARPTAVALVEEAEDRNTRDGTDDALRVTRQNRQDRVKARKLRDIESQRMKSGSRAPLTEAALTPNSAPEALPKPTKINRTSNPPGNPRRRSPSQEVARRKAAISVSPIMLVANLAPYTGVVLKSDLPLITPRKLTTSNSSKSTTGRSAEHTPPFSRDSSLSSSDHVLLSSARSSRRRTGSVRSRVLSPTGSVLESRRRERRMKRNVRERERELDERLERIEKDNRLLMSTLSGIASSFGEFSRRVEKGRKGLEPAMRELQVLAPRVSEESIKVRDDFSEDDGTSILL